MHKNKLSSLRGYFLKFLPSTPVYAHSEAALTQPAAYAKSVIWLLLTTFGFFVAWLSFAKTEEVVTAVGKLEPIGQVQTVQMPVGGVLSQTLVSEGQTVSQGQTLLILDSEASKKRLENLQRISRSKDNQIELKNSERSNYLELHNFQLLNLSSGLELEKQILDKLMRLRVQGAVSELQFLQQKNKVREMRSQIDSLKVEKLRQLAIYDQQIQNLHAEKAELATQISDVGVNIRYQEIKSPVDGVVFDLKPRGTGFVAQSSEPVMKVVPFSSLQAKVEIPSSDIGFVSEGKKVDISIDSFPATDFGVLHGQLASIGSDALPPSDMNRNYRFPAIIQLDSQQLRLRSGKELPLQVGMSLSANIKLRKVTYIQLLLGSFRDKADSLKRL